MDGDAPYLVETRGDGMVCRYLGFLRVKRN